MRDERESEFGELRAQMFSAALLDFAKSLEQTGGDADLLKELCSVLLADIPRYVEAAKVAMQADDLVRVQQHVRSLRAACAAIGASQVTALALLFEAHCRVDDIHGARLKFSQLLELVSALTTELQKWVESSTRSTTQEHDIERFDLSQAGADSCQTNTLNSQL